jgi:hypothetical protein
MGLITRYAILRGIGQVVTPLLRKNKFFFYANILTSVANIYTGKNLRIANFIAGNCRCYAASVLDSLKAFTLCIKVSAAQNLTIQPRGRLVGIEEI